MKLEYGNPCNDTVTIWVKKIGLYRLNSKKEKADDWIIILDESIQLGQEKLLVILGIRKVNIQFSKPLQFQDLVPLKEISSKRWNGEDIGKELQDLKKELGIIIYAVGDYGGELKKGLRLAKIKHVHDITHRIALILEKLYKENPEYLEFTKQMTVLRKELSQSQYAHLIPPRQREKARYQNIKSISDWGGNILKYLDRNTVEEKLKNKFGWIKRYREFIKELSGISFAINELEKLIKHKGLSKKTAKKALRYIQRAKGEKSVIIKEKLEEYFNKQLELLPDEEKILATSDIIESSFGKYKNYLSSNYMSGITNLALAIPAFTCRLSRDEIKKALESTTMKDLSEWSKKNIGDTLLHKRRQAFCH